MDWPTAPPPETNHPHIELALATLDAEDPDRLVLSMTIGGKTVKHTIRRTAAATLIATIGMAMAERK